MIEGMKPLSVHLPKEYDPLVEKLGEHFASQNPDGRVVSRSHIIRYALRIAAQSKPDPAVALRVLVTEEGRGKRKAPKPTPPGVSPSPAQV